MRAPFFVVLALIAACGGKVLVDGSGGGDPGGGQGGSMQFGAGGSNVVTTGSFGTGGVSSGTGTGTFGGGFGTAGGSMGSGGAILACGATICPPGATCCNAQCAICAPIGAGCPAIACGGGGAFGTAGSSGIGGSFGAGGSTAACGPPDSCMARIPGPTSCPSEAACLCNACSCPATTCLNDGGCQQIWQCALKFNCRGTSCYTPQTCKAVIDQYPMSMNLALQLDACLSQTGCDTVCGGAADAGAACRILPPAVGAACSGQADPSQCSEQCTDVQMNSYIAKCSGNSCTCYYNGQLACSCFNGGSNGAAGGFPNTCGICCPGWPR